jgi:hypothetical protein
LQTARRQLQVLPSSPVVPDFSSSSDLRAISGALDQIPGIANQVIGLVNAKQKREILEDLRQQRDLADVEKGDIKAIEEAEKEGREKDELDRQGAQQLALSTAADLSAEILKDGTAAGFEIPAGGIPSEILSSILAEVMSKDLFDRETPVFRQEFKDQMARSLLGDIIRFQDNKRKELDKHAKRNAAYAATNADTKEKLGAAIETLTDSLFQDFSKEEAQDYVINQAINAAIGLGPGEGEKRISEIQKAASPRHRPAINSALRTLEKSKDAEYTAAWKEFRGDLNQAKQAVRMEDLTPQVAHQKLDENAEKLGINHGDRAAARHSLNETIKETEGINRAKDKADFIKGEFDTHSTRIEAEVSEDPSLFARIGPFLYKNPETGETVVGASPAEMQRHTYTMMKDFIMNDESLTNDQKNHKLFSLLSQISYTDPELEASAENAGLGLNRTDLTEDQVPVDDLRLMMTMEAAGILGRHVRNDDDLSMMRAVFSHVNSGMATIAQAAVAVAARRTKANESGRIAAVSINMSAEPALGKAQRDLKNLGYDIENDRSAVNDYLGDVEDAVSYWNISPMEAFKLVKAKWKEEMAVVNGNSVQVPRNIMIGKNTFEVSAPWIIRHYLNDDPNPMFLKEKALSMKYDPRTGQFFVVAAGGLQHGLSEKRYNVRDIAGITDLIFTRSNAFTLEKARRHKINTMTRDIEKSKRQDERIMKLLGLDSMPKTLKERKALNKHLHRSGIGRGGALITPQHWSKMEVPGPLSAITMTQLAQHRIAQDPGMSQDGIDTMLYIAKMGDEEAKMIGTAPVSASEIWPDDPVKAALQGTRN